MIQRPYIRLIIITVAVIALGVIGWLVYFYMISFSITAISPDKNRTSRYAPIIEIKTTRIISDKEITYDDDDEGIIDSVRQYKRSIIVNLKQNLVAGKEYTINLGSITSDRGQTISSLKYSFTPQDNDSFLSDEEQAIILDRQSRSKGIAADPILGELPITTDNYIIRSSLDATSNGSGKVSLVAIVFLTPEEVTMNGYETTVAKYTAQVNDALAKLKNYSKDTYPLTITVQGP